MIEFSDEINPIISSQKKLLPENVIFVDEDYFLNQYNYETPLMFGTEFGIFPQKYADLRKCMGQRIAICCKSIKSCYPYPPDFYTVDEDNIIELRNIYGYYRMN
ncbi:hypothetical protein GO491_06625 [Flavobacteriaceae bacterium Ap0902]|nr:hypothetical protein [Flavobacteriaceae bacterium Ap0902]